VEPEDRKSGVRIRPRLLVVSLLVAVVVSAVGAYVWASVVDDDGDDVDARLEEPGVAAIPPDSVVPNADLAGGELPQAVLSDRNGAEVDTRSFLGGAPLVINLWFSTCPPCAKELPDFAAVHADVGDEVRFIGVNTIDSVEVMERFAGERGVSYELYRDDLAEFTDAIGATSFPVTIFVTSDGTIIDQTGVLDEAGLRERVAELQSIEEAA
jgi:thiol-disulfide isomerase/thioredoxin